MPSFLRHCVLEGHTHCPRYDREPLSPPRCYLVRSSVDRSLGRHHLPLIALPDSCVRPSSSLSLCFPSESPSSPVAVSPSAFPSVLSANLSSTAWPLTPAVLLVHLLDSSHEASAFPNSSVSRHLAVFPQHDCLPAFIFGAAGPSLRFRPPSWLATQVVPPVGYSSTPGRHGLYVHAYLGLSPPRAVDRLTVRIEQLTVGGLSPSKICDLAGRS